MNTPKIYNTTPTSQSSLLQGLESRAASIMPHINDPEFVGQNYERVMGLGIALFHFLEEEKTLKSGRLSDEDRKKYEDMYDVIEGRLAEQDKMDWGKSDALTARQMETYGKAKGIFPGLDKLKLEFPK